MATAQKCVHKGCGKTFTDPDAEDCVYHPGPPEFHEGQKGWKCCKPRFLTFDEFLAIPPCTTGKHSAVDDTPSVPKKQLTIPDDVPTIKPISTSRSSNNANNARTAAGTTSSTLATAQATTPARSTTPQPPQLEEDSDDPSTPISANASCKRRACGKSSSSTIPREEEVCVYHPGVPLFHEGSKGWTCCKRRVLEFDEFMKIAGCKERKRHCYVGKKKSASNNGGQKSGAEQDEKEKEEMLEDVRNDFYQTPNSVIVSFYLKKIDKTRASVTYPSDGRTVELDLPTSDGKRYRKQVVLWGSIKPDESSFKIMGTKLEMVLVKTDGSSWPILREGDPDTGERIQVGRAGRA